jgi:hypothetical protein
MSQENLSKRHLIERCLDALADMPFGAQCQFQSLRFRGQKSVAEDKLLTLLAEDLEWLRKALEEHAERDVVREGRLGQVESVIRLLAAELDRCNKGGGKS